VTEVQAPGAQAAPVEFVGARSDESVRTRLRVRAALFFLFGLWCVGAAFAGYAVAGALAAVLWLELGGACVCALAVAGGTSDDPAVMQRVAAAVREICDRAGCAAPRVALSRDPRRPAGIRRAKPRPVLILAVPYVERIDDVQLRAIVGHEVAHVTCGDLAAARRRRLLTLVPAMALGFAWGYTGADLMVAPLLSAAYVAAMIAIAAAVAPANRRREVRADAEGPGSAATLPPWSPRCGRPTPSPRRGAAARTLGRCCASCSPR